MTDEDAFVKARGCFEEMLGFLEGSESAQLSHADLEDEIVRRGREAQRLAFQDHLDLRALRERRVRVVDAKGVAHGAVETGHRRQLETVVGAVGVERLAYRHVRSANLHPADAALSLPDQLHSHGLRRLAAAESTRASFDDASQAVCRAPAWWWPSARWRTSPPERPPTWRRSTRRGSTQRSRGATPS